MDIKAQIGTVYPDLKKAFDRVDHEILQNGIRGNLLRWFQSYVTYQRSLRN